MYTMLQRTRKPRPEPAAGDPNRLLLYHVWRAENSFSRTLEDAFRPLGISIAQCGVLSHLDLLGPLSAADLSRLIHHTPQGIASTVRRLVASGWIDRRPHPIHGRIVVLTLTDEGKRALDDAMAVAEDVEAFVTEGLSRADRAALTRALDHMQERALRRTAPED
jgi:DNA-binding MarR family transcriptional regulator